MKLNTHENVGWGKIAIPEESFHTSGMWLSFDEPATRDLDRDQVATGLAGIAHVLRNIAPVYCLCDARDIGAEAQVRFAIPVEALGFHDDQIQGDVGALSGGWKMRVALAKILLLRPDMLLLDEPTNYLDLESILWLEGFLRDYDGAVIMTCHDREIMNRIVSKIVEIDGGDVRTYGGNYEFYEKARAEASARHEAEYARQQAMLAKESRFIERFAAHAAKAAQVQSRVKALDKIEKIELPKDAAPYSSPEVGDSLNWLTDTFAKAAHARAVVDGQTVNLVGIIKGSGRSIPTLHLRDALELLDTRHPGLMGKFGGHAMAAGLTLPKANIEAFGRAFEAVIGELVTPELLTGVLLTDGELLPDELTLELAELIRASGPWGQAFPEPLFDGEFVLVQQRLVGEKHLKMMLTTDSGHAVDAIAFGAFFNLLQRKSGLAHRALEARIMRL